jgi:hypothetical protein
VEEYYLLKLQIMQNKILCTKDNFPRLTSVRDMHQAFHMPYDDDYINHAVYKQKSSKIVKMIMFDILDKSNQDTENIRGLNLAAVMCMTVQVTRISS